MIPQASFLFRVVHTKHSPTASRAEMHQYGQAAALEAVRNICTHHDLSSLQIVPDSMGKPQVFDHSTLLPVSLSISHATPLCLAVASPIPNSAVGCDVERIRNFTIDTVAAFLTPREKINLNNLPVFTQLRAQTLLWSYKESVLKAAGTGIRMHPRRLELNLGNEFQATTVTFDGRPLIGSLSEVKTDLNHVATVAYFSSDTLKTIRLAFLSRQTHPITT